MAEREEFLIHSRNIFARDRSRGLQERIQTRNIRQPCCQESIGIPFFFSLLLFVLFPYVGYIIAPGKRPLGKSDVAGGTRREEKRRKYGFVVRIFRLKLRLDTGKLPYRWPPFYPVETTPLCGPSNARKFHLPLARPPHFLLPLPLCNWLRRLPILLLLNMYVLLRAARPQDVARSILERRPAILNGPLAN